MPKFLKTIKIYQSSRTEIIINLDSLVTASPNEAIKTATSITLTDGNTLAIDMAFEDFVKLFGNDVN